MREITATYFSEANKYIYIYIMSFFYKSSEIEFTDIEFNVIDYYV